MPPSRSNGVKKTAGTDATQATRPQFAANLRLLFPELEALPHADTLFRLLRDRDVAHLEQVHIDFGHGA